MTRAADLPTYAVRFDGPKFGILPVDGAASGLDGALVKSVRGAALDSGVVAGDLLCRVNDMDVLFKPFAFVNDVLRTAHRPCTIEFIPGIYGADLYQRLGVVPLPPSTPRNDPLLHRLDVILRHNDNYDELLHRMQEISRRVTEIGTANVRHPDAQVQRDLREEYFVLERDMEACHEAIQHTAEYILEQNRLQEAWDDADADDALRALYAVRRMLPVNIQSLSEAALTGMITPNGQTIACDVARKFKRTNILELLRTDPADVARSHPSVLENRRTTGLTLTERRALHAHLRDVGRQWATNYDSELGKRRYDWFQRLRGEYVSSVNAFTAHVAQFGRPGSHPYATPEAPDVGCPLRGKQCPLIADASPAYASDYGYPDGPVYMVVEVHNDCGIADIPDAPSATTTTGLAKSACAHPQRPRPANPLMAAIAARQTTASTGTSRRAPWIAEITARGQIQADDFVWPPAREVEMPPARQVEMAIPTSRIRQLALRTASNPVDRDSSALSWLAQIAAFPKLE